MHTLSDGLPQHRAKPLKVEVYLTFKATLEKFLNFKTTWLMARFKVHWLLLCTFLGLKLPQSIRGWVTSVPDFYYAVLLCGLINMTTNSFVWLCICRAHMENCFNDSGLICLEYMQLKVCFSAVKYSFKSDFTISCIVSEWLFFVEGQVYLEIWEINCNCVNLTSLDEVGKQSVGHEVK